MKRKGLAVLGLTVALVVGGATTALAAGWQQTSSGAWEYYDNSGNRETDVWRKGADGLWRYIGGNGYMVTNSWIDDTYYVDNDGVMAAGKWLQLESNSGNYDGLVWYYFNSDGKRVEEMWKKINNKWYYFDEEGVMQTGWVLDNTYYTNESGAMVTGWQKLYPPEDEYYEEDSRNEPVDANAGDGTYWYYFGSNGKKVVPDDSNGSEYQERKINGEYYCFDYTGRMQTGWKNVGEDSTIESYKYYDENGKAVTGTWMSLYAPEEFDDYGDVQWYYFDSRGIPEMGPEEGQATTKDLKRVNGLTFLFNEKGNPIYGLHKVYTDEDEGEYTAYYFGSDRLNCAMLTGKQKVEESDGNVVQYYFLDSGKGYTGVNGGYLYYMGRLQYADSGDKYLAISLPTSSGMKNYLVNTSGKTVKNTTVRDNNGTKYKTGSNGIILKINDEDVGSETFASPQEPLWWESWDNY